MDRLLRWVVPDSAIWSWRDQVAVFYDGLWATVDPRERFRYMAIYGVGYR